MQAYAPLVEYATCEMEVTARGGQGARAMAALLADIGQLYGLTALSMRCETDPFRVRRPDDTETATVRFRPQRGEQFQVQVLLHPELIPGQAEGLVLVNSPRRIDGARVRTVDANAIATALGVPAYLPMIGAVARSAGWHDLSRIKTALKMALETTAPFWIEPAMVAVEAGFHSTSVENSAK